MVRTILGLLLVVVVSVQAALAQATRCYHQKVDYTQQDGGMFNNTYYLYANGTFEHSFITEDGQEWYGKGHYTVNFFRYKLTFEKIMPKKFINNYETTLGQTYYIESRTDILKKRGKYVKMRDKYHTVKGRHIKLAHFDYQERRSLGFDGWFKRSTY